MPRTKPHITQTRALSPLRDFLAAESAGAVLLAGASIIALVWANSPWSSSYDSLWDTRFAIDLAGHVLDLDLRHWVNDALMTLFFLVVGLEIKREVVSGHLASFRSALMPGLAALGGMAIPALVYLAIAGSVAPKGWAIPVATDIALAIGVLSIGGTRVPTSLRAFLLGLAIVDDIGAIVIIALFYSSGVSPMWLCGFAAAVTLTLAVRRAGIHTAAVYWSLGAAAWLCLQQAGVHPTLAGVAFGLLAPTTPRHDPDYIDVEQLADVNDVHAAQQSVRLARGSVSVVEWLLHSLHPLTGYVIVPVFALANAGIDLSLTSLRSAAGSAVAWGIVAGLVCGKPLGIAAMVGLARRTGIAEPPHGVDRSRLAGVGAAGGIGFTVALFITELAFDDPTQRSEAKLAVFVASLIAAALTAWLLRRPSHDGSTLAAG